MHPRRRGDRTLSVLARARLLFSTLRHLRPSQLAVWVLRRAVQERLDRWAAQPAEAQPFAHPVSFRFLNRDVSFAAGELDWRPPGVPRLWGYNLHYFQYLDGGDLEPRVQRDLIAHWIHSNPPGSSPGWEPYALSLRLVSWCRWLLRNAEPPAPQLLASAVAQARWLQRRPEKHILANHYFENLKALVFAGAVLPAPDASRWLRMGRAGLFAQVHEQFLPDGGHYERSPSYHCVLLGGLLDLLELDRAVEGALGAPLREAVEQAAIRAMALLAGIEFPGDCYPLFNDSAFNSAPRPSVLYSRAQALRLRWTGLAADRVELPCFGVFGWRDANAGELLLKCGDVGPAYQPGHTHCDMLSFEWYLGGLPFVVDTGVYEYEPGPMRHYVRSTAAHNTVAVEGAEQSEIWGEFRVARRARVLRAGIEAVSGGLRFSGEILAFPALGGGIRHRRVVELLRSGAAWNVRIEDELRGKGHAALGSRLLFHPDIEIIPESDQACLLRLPHGGVVRLSSLHGGVMQWCTAPYCPGFGVRRDAPQLLVRTEGALPARMGFVFESVGPLHDP
jgi:uncharacterized heparinase superfamily protein